MRYYEMLYIVSSNLEDDGLDKTMSEIKEELEKTKSKVINHRVWGKKRLAYQINNQKYGSYILMEYEGGDPSKMIEYDTWMKLNNVVLRHMIVALKEKPEAFVEEVKKELPSEEKSKTKEKVLTEESDSNSELSEKKEISEEVAKEEVAKEEVAKEEAAKEEVAKEEVAKEEVAKEEVAKEEVAKEEEREDNNSNKEDK